MVLDPPDPALSGAAEGSDPSEATDPSEAWDAEAGDWHFHVRHEPSDAPGLGPGGSLGPRRGVLRVRERASGRVRLVFDCGEPGPSLALDPEGDDIREPVPAAADPIAWSVGRLREDLAGLLDKAGAAGSALPSPGSLDSLLAAAEAALRDPPVDLEHMDLERLRSRLSEKWETYPEVPLPAWVAEMDFPLADPIRRVVQRAVDRSDLGYPIDPRRTGVLEAFCQRMESRFGWSVESRRCELLSDVVQGQYIGVGAYSAPGDGVVVQTPIYPPFLHAVRETGRRLVENRGEPTKGRFEFDLDALDRAADEGTRLLLLCSPHNPSGRVFSRAELEALGERVLERDWIVISDEIHGDLVFPGARHLPFASLDPELARRTVTLTSATKAFNIPGLRCCVAHFGSPDLQRRFNDSIPRHVRGGLGLLGLYATRAAWLHGQPWLDRVVAHLDDNRRFLGRFVAERLPGVRCFVPEATYLAWLDCSELGLPQRPAHFFAERAGVVLSDGHVFGSGLEQAARINFATSRRILTLVLEAMADAVERWRRG